MSEVADSATRDGSRAVSQVERYDALLDAIDTRGLNLVWTMMSVDQRASWVKHVLGADDAYFPGHLRDCVAGISSQHGRPSRLRILCRWVASIGEWPDPPPHFPY
jgi:hypothetical protein